MKTYNLDSSKPIDVGNVVQTALNAISRLAMIVVLVSTSSLAGASDANDPLKPWRTGVSVRPISAQPGRHTIHTYYLLNPESPEGSRLLFFASSTPEGEHGDIVVLDRASGNETVIARGIDTEDAHRAACQQWISGGTRVAYHDVKNDQWSVHVIDLPTRISRKIPENRQLGFGRAVDDLLPLYGCHWKPGRHRGIELLNALTGEIRTVLTIDDVEQQHGPWLTKEFAGRPASMAFPTISPDGKRVFFKMSAPGSAGALNDFKSRKASHRQGLLVYDLATKTSLFMREKWGHPAWHPDSRRILQVGNLLLDVEKGGDVLKMPDLPTMPGCHPSMSSDGKLFVMDGRLDNVGGPAGRWGIVVCDVRGHQYQILHQFDNSGGAKTWRKNHPHPAFSSDAKRIYFNVNEGNWTQLYVAELTER